MLPDIVVTSFIATLFSMMNPIGNLGVFAGMTADRPDAESRRIAWTCAAAVAITLLVVTWTGSLLLELFGISVDALRAAGGIIVLVIGLHMLFNKAEHKHSSAEVDDAKQRASVAVVPLAIPIVAGPGAMAAILVASQQHPTVLNKLEMSLVIVGLSALTGLLFHFAGPVSRRLGESGMGVVTRVMGLVLAAIAMGMLTGGLKSLLPGLAG